ncbi:MAG: aquaporin, partial [Actinomycetota bacterium]|nr:aquaporin [Actinomycetota bacterium]
MVRRLFAEYLGTAMLVAAVVGSGIMGSALTGDAAVILILNMMSTVLALGVLIWMLGPISGAHFNPAVTTVTLVKREVRVLEGLSYIVVQILGGLCGVALANVMFDLPAFDPST